MAYHFVYKTENFKFAITRLATYRDTLSKVKKNSELHMSQTPDITKKGIDKQDAKVKQAQEQHDHAAALMTAQTTRPKMLSSAFAFFVMWQLSSAYAGTVVAVLPFEPLPFMRMLTKRTLGEDVLLPTACSFTFIYLLVNVGVKAVLSKMVSFGPQFEGGGMKSIINAPSTKIVMKRMGWTTKDLDEFSNFF